jgi:hypothetical protein
VKYGIRKGISELDKKLIKTYGTGISAALAKAMAQSVARPLSMEELNRWVAAFQTTGPCHEIEIRLKRAREEASTNDKLDDKRVKDELLQNQISLGQQIRVLIERQVTLSWRNPQVIRFQGLQNMVFGIVLGSLYSNLLGSELQTYTLSMVIAIILGVVAMITVALNTGVAFADKQVFVREQNDDMYSPVAHFFSRLLVGVPLNIIVAACLILPAYWWVGLRSGANYFFFFFGSCISHSVLGL